MTDAPVEATVQHVIRVFIVEDHAVVREALVAVLDREADIEVIGQAASAEDAVQAVQALDPDIIVADNKLPNRDGADLCRDVAELGLRARVIVLSALRDPASVRRAFQAGAYAFVPKDVEPDELLQLIRSAVRSDNGSRSPAGARNRWSNGHALPSDSGLRPSELSILRLLGEGKSNAEIARLTGRSPQTVKSYLREIYRKLGVNRRAQAAAVALRKHLI